LAYGRFWWFLGPLTIFPLWQGQAADWSYERGSAVFGSLVGHTIYGLLVGLVYATIDRLWLGFFVESDPIHREVEGPGTRTLQSLGWGAVASLAGGLFFSLIMVASGSLTWTTEAAGAMMSFLIGHLVYRAATALIFILLQWRHQVTPRPPPARPQRPSPAQGCHPGAGSLALCAGFKGKHNDRRTRPSSTVLLSF
jgi:hypothetical protein